MKRTPCCHHQSGGGLLDLVFTTSLATAVILDGHWWRSRPSGFMQHQRGRFTATRWRLMSCVRDVGPQRFSVATHTVCASPLQSTFERSRRSARARSPGTSSATWRTQRAGWTRRTASSSSTEPSSASSRSAWQVAAPATSSHLLLPPVDIE